MTKIKLLALALGVQIFVSEEYEKVSAESGVIFCGGPVDNEHVSMLESLGWGWDEGNDRWYLLVDID